MHKDYSAQQREKQLASLGLRQAGTADQDTVAGVYAGCLGAAKTQSTDVQALESIGQRLQSLSISINDTNCDTLAFIERTLGAEPARPEPAPVNADFGERTPHLTAISILIDRLQYHIYQADQLCNRLKRIG